jgi:2-furoate---CoA ligase
MDVARLLTWTAERYPHHIGVGGPAPMTYREWDSRTNQVARALAGLGVRPRDRVAFLLAGGEPMASLHLAVQKLGAVSVPLSIRFSAVELAYCLGDAALCLLVCDNTTAGLVAAAAGQAPPTGPHSPRAPVQAYLGAGAAPPGSAPLCELAAGEPDGALPAPIPLLREGDLSVMLYTSGTTGRPKGVPRTHRAEHTAAVAHVIQTQQRPGEVTLGVMPMFHTMGLRTLLASIIVGGIWVPQAAFSAEESLELITGHGVSSLYLVPTVYWSLLRTGRLPEAASVRRLAYAGAAMTPALARDLAAALRPEVFVNHFGSTEIYTFTICPDAAAKPGCAGRAGVFSRVRLVDPSPGAPPDVLVGPGEQGQVAVSMASPEAFGGYWRRPDADARTIRDGWYFPGDLAVADADGDFWVSGRVDDMIVSGGENIYPGEIEEALARCPAVADVVVAGLPDDRWGHAVTAFVVPCSGLAPAQALAEVDGFVRDGSGLPSLKRPKRLVAVDRIPTSAVGKILRRQLTEGRYTALAETSPGDGRPGGAHPRQASPEQASPQQTSPGCASTETAP